MMKTLCLILFLLTGLVMADGLDGRNVILVVSEHRSGDPKAEAVRGELMRAREELGLDKVDMPIVFMGFEDSDTERQYFDRLGFKSIDSPVLCVVEWGNPGRFGPKQVVDHAIARSATPQHVEFIVANWLKATGRTEGPVTVKPPSEKPEEPENQGPGELEIISTRFEVSGKPLFLTNARIRIKNVDEKTLRDITIRFYSKRTLEDDWNLMGKKILERLPVGFFASPDLVKDTKSFGLVDELGSSVHCYYRIEVEHGGRVQAKEGEFTPAEGPVRLRQ